MKCLFINYYNIILSLLWICSKMTGIKHKSMKKIIFSVVAMLMSLTSVAEVNFWDNSKPENKWTFGLRAGVNSAWLGNDDSKELKSKTGFFGGVGVDFRFRNCIGINSGLFFTQKGCKADNLNIGSGFSHADTRMTMNFIELPVYVSWRVMLGGNHSVQLFMGPFFDYGVYGKMTVNANASGTKVCDSMDLYKTEGFNRFQVGAGVGLAYSYDHFSIGFSYQEGGSDIASDYTRVRWDNINVSIGFNF